MEEARWKNCEVGCLESEREGGSEQVNKLETFLAPRGRQTGTFLSLNCLFFSFIY